MVDMSAFYKRLKEHLEQLTPPMSFNQLHFLAEIGTSQFSNWKMGRRLPSDAELQKIASVERLGLTYSILYAWRLIDLAPDQESLEIALKRFPEYRKGSG